MQPTDIEHLRVPGRPALTADGGILVALARPDLETNDYRSDIQLVRAGARPRPFTVGPKDSAPVTAPAGDTVVFLRAVEAKPPQLYAMPVGGGEPRRLTDHLLGAGPAVFDPSGARIAYCAPVPDPGRYGTDSAVDPDAEPPRRITRCSYRLDGKGFVLDRGQQVFLLELADGAQPVQLTDEPGGASSPAFAEDGRVLYVRETAPDELTHEIAVLAAPGASGGLEPPSAVGEMLVRPGGDIAALVAHGGTLYFTGHTFDGIDQVGRNAGLFAVPGSGGPVTRLTDEETVGIDAMAGDPVLAGNRLIVAVAERGTVSLRMVPLDASSAALDELPVVIRGGVVKGFTARDGRLAAAVARPDSAGEVVVADLAADGVAEPVVLTEFSQDIRAHGIRPVEELAGAAPDGYPVHGFLVLPEGPGPHPVLLVVHGGPHSAHTAALFDEAQVYAAAGYAVVLPNPRGSAGYGQRHGRAVVGTLGTVDVDDVLALLDAALARESCDAARVGVMGGSYGGFMTTWLAGHTGLRFAAAVSERAVNVWDSFSGSSDIGYWFAAAYVGADRAGQWAASPLAYADAIEIPMLIVHSEQDWRCPLEQAQRLFVALRGRGVPAEMLVFPGEGHELSRSGKPAHRVQRFATILSWWERYLPVR